MNNGVATVYEDIDGEEEDLMESNRTETSEMYTCQNTTVN